MFKEQFSKMSTFRKRAFAVALATAVASTSFNVGSYAVEAGSSANGRVITAFEELPEDILYQYLPVGSKQSDIIFPEELNVTLYSDTEEETTEDIVIEETPEEEPAEEEPAAEETPEPAAEPDAGTTDGSTDAGAVDSGSTDNTATEEPAAGETATDAGNTESGSTEEAGANTGEGGSQEGSTGESTQQESSPEETNQEETTPEESGSTESTEETAADESSIKDIRSTVASVINAFKPVTVYAAEGEGEEGEPLSDSDDENKENGGEDSGSDENNADGENPEADEPEGENAEEGSGADNTNEEAPGENTGSSDEGNNSEGNTDEGNTDEGNTDEGITELGDGEARVLKDVNWKLVRDESTYNRFQAVLEGDVFVYEPRISEYGLKSDVELPKIRVTIVAAQETVSEDTVSEDTVSEDTVSANSPEFSQMMIVGGVRVTVEAPEGVFPEGAVLHVKKLDGDSLEKAENYVKEDMGASSESPDGEDGEDEEGSAKGLDMVFFDVTITDAEGNELQPNTEFGEATVKFANVDIVGNYLDTQDSEEAEGGDNSAELKVYHFEEGMESAEKLEPQVDGGDNAVTVNAGHFSEFGVVLSTQSANTSSGDYGDFHFEFDKTTGNFLVSEEEDYILVQVQTKVTMGSAKIKVSNSDAFKSGEKKNHGLLIKSKDASTTQIVNLILDSVEISAANTWGGLHIDGCETKITIAEGTSKIENTNATALRTNSALTIEQEEGKDSSKCILILNGKTYSLDGFTNSGTVSLKIEGGTIKTNWAFDHVNSVINGGFVIMDHDNRGGGTDNKVDTSSTMQINSGTHLISQYQFPYNWYTVVNGPYQNDTNSSSPVVNGGSVGISGGRNHCTVMGLHGKAQYVFYFKDYKNSKVQELFGDSDDSTDNKYNVKRTYELKDTYTDELGYLYLWLDHTPGDGYNSQGTAKNNPFGVKLDVGGNDVRFVRERSDGSLDDLFLKPYFSPGSTIFNMTEYKPVTDMSLSQNEFLGGTNHLANFTTFEADGKTLLSNQLKDNGITSRMRDVKWSVSINGTAVNEGDTTSKAYIVSGTNNTDDPQLVLPDDLGLNTFTLVATLERPFDGEITKYFTFKKPIAVEGINLYKVDSVNQETQINSGTLELNVGKKYVFLTNKALGSLDGDYNFKVNPSSADNQTITLSMNDDYVRKSVDESGNYNYTFLKAGTYTLTATVKDGLGENKDYTKNFTIEVKESSFKLEVKDWTWEGGSYAALSSKFTLTGLQADNAIYGFYNLCGSEFTTLNESTGEYEINEKKVSTRTDISNMKLDTYVFKPDKKLSEISDIKPNAGVYLARCKDNSSGEAVYYVFQIFKQEIDSDDVTLSPFSGTYDRAAHALLTAAPTINNQVATYVTASNLTYSIDDGTPTTAIPERTDAGTYSIKAILSGADNYKGSVSASAKINKKKITDSTIKVKTPIATQYYTGSAVTLSSEALVIYDGDESNTLLEGTDFTTEYKNNNAAGTATVTIKGKGNYDESSSRSVNFVIKEYDAGALNVLYNGTTKAEWYSDDVKISADGYLVSDSRTGEFADNYSLTGSGTVTKTLYFKDKTNGAIPAQEITVKIDRKAPSGKIEAVKESWTKFQNSKKTAAYTNEQKSVTITGSDSDSKVNKIQYFISDTFYSGQNQAESAGKGKWETYSSSAKPGLSENSLNYIYAKVTDKAGNTFYMSSEGIWYDTKAPKVTTAKATPKDTSTTVQVKATDTKGSGVKFVYVLVKKKDESKPTAKTVQSSGKKKELSKEDGKDDFEITGLTAKTGYVVYTVAEDFCKNLSEVKETKITTKESSSSSSSGTGGAGKKDGAAGADGAGGSNAAKRGVSSDSAKKGGSDSASENEGEGSDGIKNKVPFIDDASEGILTGREYTSGWDKIENEALSAQAPAEIHIEMNGATVVPAKMLNDIADRDVTMYFEMGDGIIWAVNGLSFTSVPQQDIDFKVKKNTKNIPSKLLTEVADVYPHTNLTLSHDGNFGFTAIMSLDMGADNSGMFGNLYYYNEDAGSLEFIDSREIGGSGNVQFEFTHASDYTVIVRGDALTEKTAAALTVENSDSDLRDYSGKGSISGAENVAKRSNHLWLLIISIISILLCGFILFMPDKKKWQR